MKRLLAATAVTATLATGLAAPALADPPPGPGDRQGPGPREHGPSDRYPDRSGNVRVVYQGMATRDGSATVWVVYRLPYRRPAYGPTHAEVDLTLRQGRVWGEETVGHLRADGRTHYLRVTVDPNGRYDFRPGRASVDADLNTRARTLDFDAHGVYLRGWWGLR